MRLGIAVFIVPFFFILNPSLILHGPSLMIFHSIAAAFAGITLIASGLEGYLAAVEPLGLFEKMLCLGGGMLLAFPGLRTDLIGIAGLVLLVSIVQLRRRLSKKPEVV